MADGEAHFAAKAPMLARLARVFYLSPGEPRDVQTLNALVSATLEEAREALFIDPKAGAALAMIGRTGSFRHIRALETLVADRIAERLHNPPFRQRVKGALIRFYCVPQPKKGEVFGTLRVFAWSHVVSTTFDFHTMRTHP